MQRLIKAYNSVGSAYEQVAQHAQQVTKNLELIMTQISALSAQLKQLQDRCNRHLPPELPPLVDFDSLVPTTTTAKPLSTRTN